MKLVIQRVKEASVKDESSGKAMGRISAGYLVLAGVGRGDGKERARTLARKLSKLRIMSDAQGKMNLSLKEASGEVLVVSQFTLYGDTSGGNRPSFVNAAEADEAKEVYEEFVKELKDLGEKVETGSFGSYMEIKAILDGPVTIQMEA